VGVIGALCNGDKPGQNRAFAPEFVKALQSPEKGLLGELFGNGRVGTELVEKAVDRR